MSSKKRIFLIHQDDIFKKIKLLPNNSDTAWVFFIRDYGILLKLRERLPASFRQIEITKRLRNVSQELRKPYIDYIGYLGDRFDSIQWWTSRIAESNTLVSPLFLYICYFEIFKGLIKDKGFKENNLCIISESYSLLKLIGNMSEINKWYEVRFLSWYGLLLKKAQFSFIAFFRILRFLKRESVRKLISLLIPAKTKLETDEEYTFIRTWVSEGFFKGERDFSDGYFGDLSKKLREKGLNAKIVPIIYSVMKTYPELIRWFRRNEKEFLLLDDLYSFSNLFQAVLIGIKQLLLIRGTRFEFGLKDLSLLFYEELQRTVFGPMMLEFNLYYYFIANLKKRKIKIKNFILTFENMFHEKALLIGLKEFYPQTKVIGYQHALLYPMLLCLSLPHEKGRSMPMPDKIVCCGQMSKEILSNEGFSCDKLLPGPALRHNYLHQLRGSSPQKEYTYDKKRVLVAGIEDPHITLELLTKVYIALKQESDIETYFIPHPNMKKTEMDNLFKNSLIKKDFFKFTNGPIKDSLLNTDCLIASTTAAIFDALCLGVPVIRLHRETDIIIDPLDWLDEDSSYFLPSAAGVNVSKVGFASNNIQRLKPWSFKATSPSELKEMFKQIKRLSKAQRDEFSDIGQEMLHKYFSPVNEESYEVFV